MPKVNVYPSSPNPDSVPDRRVEVGWHPHGFVQIGTTVRNPVKAIKVDGVDGTTATMAVSPGGTVDEDGWTWDGQFTDLDRHSINQLIRALREARDKAYGRDE